MTKKSTTPTNPVDALSAMMEANGFGFNEMVFYLTQIPVKDEKERAGLVSQAIAGNVQGHLQKHGFTPTCPECGSHNHKKKGKRGVVQRYQCQDCGRKYTLAAGTMLDKTRYSWEAWVKVLACFINGYSIPRTQKVLKDDLKCADIDIKTVWKMRLKIMNAINQLPIPQLHGIIKVDDTYFRENQKGTAELVNVLPEDLVAVREPRKGATPSKYGVMGNEFATATVAVDDTGHVICRMMGLGPNDPDIVETFITHHMDDVKFICSDADRTYKKVIKRLGYPHYVKPSNYLKVLEKAGYEQVSENDEELAKLQREHDNKVMMRLYETGKIDHINNIGELSYPAFCELKYANGLNLAQVNEIHAEMKRFIYGTTLGGVATRYLPLYLSMFEYLHNRKVDTGEDAVSEKDAEEILVELVKTGANLTEDDIEQLRKQPIAEVFASRQYMRLLAENTDRARRITHNARFKFNSDDNVNDFKVEKTLFSMNIAQIKAVARIVDLAGRGSMKKTEMVYALTKCDGIKDAIMSVLLTGEEDREDKAAAAKAKYTYKPEGKNRVVHKDTFPPRMYTTIDEAATLDPARIVFVDTETTGLNKQTDEVLTIAAVDGEGTVKMDQMFHPRHRKRWSDATRINGITPEMTIGKPTLPEKKAEIEKLFDEAAVIVGWNLSYDIKMLYAGGVDLPMVNEKYCDLMADFTRAYNSTLSGKGKAKYKLAEAAAAVGLEYDAHTAIGDTSVLLPIWEWTRDTLAASDGHKAA